MTRRRRRVPRWRESAREKRRRTDSGLSFVRYINRFHVGTPPAGVPGFLMAALPFVLVTGLILRIPGFWQLPAVAATGVVFGIALLRWDWPRPLKFAAAIFCLTGSALAFVLLDTPVAPFVLPLVAAAFVLALWRARAAERDARERDAWCRS